MTMKMEFLIDREPSQVYCRVASPANAVYKSPIVSKMGSKVINTAKSQQSEGWQDTLLQASNYASMLCVVDCTVLPLVTIGFPLMGMVADPSTMGWLHEVGHSMALFFVLPMGGSATILNYLYAHRTNSIAALGILGLLLVFMSNAPHSIVEGTSGRLHHILHHVHHGMTHHLANIAGCCCLLASNFFSQKTGKCLYCLPFGKTNCL